MTNIEIKQEIDKIKVELENEGFNEFVLNSTIGEKLLKIKELQSQCQHDYDENGICQYCGTTRK